MIHAAPKNNKVLLGLSGGVDSTAAALLLKEKGYEVTGLFFDVLGDQEQERAAAEHTAKELGIPFICKNVQETFRTQIISYFCDSYINGETPNPCVVCNPTVKFRILSEAADEIGAFYIATGHYARVEKDERDGRYYLLRAQSRKDQSYMLYRLPQSVLARLLLPLGESADKSEIRKLVRAYGINNADKKDSQEICFIKEGTYADYIKALGYQNAPGDFVDVNGKVLGRHNGLLSYTIGQRKGLGITFGKPTFVIRLDAAKNQVVLGNDKDLFNHIVYLKDVFLSCDDNETTPLSSDKKSSALSSGKILPAEWEGLAVTAKIRYGAPLAAAKIESFDAGMLRLIFDEPQRAAAAGQSAVFYLEDRLLGGGVICQMPR